MRLSQAPKPGPERARRAVDSARCPLDAAAFEARALHPARRTGLGSPLLVYIATWNTSATAATVTTKQVASRPQPTRTKSLLT